MDRFEVTSLLVVDRKNCLLGILGASTVQLKFTSLDGQSAVDDVYVDPMASSG